ncbi:hypothetical protein AJ80_00593 [Polytolypa hystricis UAMH7299]|uniref:Uncharacterized protein n=1 Tax=Polytolypa hystricis (strain UAMH7299) TaxID=1447883 RepID=A0A2B7Z2G4_POLH7|nr:hypothetical protein AJ80_00593 [Polytolypa hystricis UAMH7299]
MASRTEFGVSTPATEVSDAFAEEIKGKNVVITGISPDSIGGAMAMAIASKNPNKLILASRTEKKLAQVAAKILDAYPDVSVVTVLLDLARQQSVIQAAKEINRQIDRLDVIINNAGLMVTTHQFTPEGIEMQFGTNHIGHFLLTGLLLPKLRAAAKLARPGSTRVVNLASQGHRLSPIRFHDLYFAQGAYDVPEDEQPPKGLPEAILKGKDGYPGFLAYGQSKTANILFAIELTNRFKKEGIISFSLHPGSIWTGLSRDLNPDEEVAIKKTSAVWSTHDQGAATAVVAAFDPALSNQHGGYLIDCQLGSAGPRATDNKAARKLWELSEELTGYSFEGALPNIGLLGKLA